MSYLPVTVLLFLAMTFLQASAQDTTQGGQNNNKSKVNSVQQNTDRSNSATVDSTKWDVNNYSGIYVWDDFLQMYPATIAKDTLEWYYIVKNKIMNDINAEFIVQDEYYDSSWQDTMIVIKYLYYLKDKMLFAKSNSSHITNSIYFYRYNYYGTNATFNELTKEKVIARDFSVDQRYFAVSIRTFRAHAIMAPKRLITKGAVGFGILNYPFKYRPQKDAKDFSGSFNIGAAVAYTYKHDSASKWRFSHVLGFGISSITLDKSTVARGADTLSSTNNITALTFSYGFMVQYDKIQLGAFIGFDQISKLNNQTFGWKYQCNPWLSVGIGYSIFSTSSSSQQSKADTQP